MIRRSRRLVAGVIALATVSSVPAGVTSAHEGRGGHHADDGPAPVVLFPAYNFTTLEVRVDGQTTDAACPASGTFHMRAFIDEASTFSPVCQDELLTLRSRGRGVAEQRGVTVSIADYGSTASAPFYEPMYERLEAAGYVRDHDIRVAGYDFRLTPDLGGFLARTKRLIEETSRANGGRPVHLVGHSNGPIYAQYLLTHVSDSWKERYIHGFTPLAGNFPGQGSLYGLLFTGLNVTDFTLPATPEKASSASALLRAAPSSYLSASDPDVIGDRLVVVVDRSTGRSYTPVDWPQLLADAGLRAEARLARRYIGSVPFATPDSFPDVDVYAEKGSGLETLVGFELADLTVGQLIDDPTAFLVRDGDINQEDLTNDAVAVWSAMECFRFSLTDNPGVDHFSLVSQPDVLDRLVVAATGQRSRCED